MPALRITAEHENLAWLKDSGRPFVFRVPLIPGITDTDENLSAIARFAGDSPVELLPYNVMAGAKYASVGRSFPSPRSKSRTRRKKRTSFPSSKMPR